MTDLFREVEEDLRREQFSRLWEKYGIYVIGTAVAIVLIVAAIVGWRAWSHSKAVEASAQYEALVAEIAEADPEKSAAAFANSRMVQVVAMRCLRGLRRRTGSLLRVTAMARLPPMKRSPTTAPPLRSCAAWPP